MLLWGVWRIYPYSCGRGLLDLSLFFSLPIPFTFTVTIDHQPGVVFLCCRYYSSLSFFYQSAGLLNLFAAFVPSLFRVSYLSLQAVLTSYHQRPATKSPLLWFSLITLVILGQEQVHSRTQAHTPTSPCFDTDRKRESKHIGTTYLYLPLRRLVQYAFVHQDPRPDHGRPRSPDLGLARHSQVDGQPTQDPRPHEAPKRPGRRPRSDGRGYPTIVCPPLSPIAPASQKLTHRLSLSALTLELLEEAFYREGFAKFPAADFTALGLSESQIKDLQGIGSTEEAHVILLQSAIAAANVKPVQACTYNFAAVDSAAAMVATAAVLENVGVSAYLGAAQLVADPGILTTAASILTVEARHQTFIRAASGVVAVPQAFDTPLSPKQVFSLAAPFIASCPEGSNLILTAFPTLTMGGDGKTVAAAGSEVKLQSSDAAATAGAKFCAFTTGGIPGGTAFTTFDAATGGCVVPQGLKGVVYVNLASAGPLTGKLTDDIIVAGPIVMQVS